MSYLPSKAFENFAAAYPEQPQVFDHQLCDHPLMQLEALAGLAERLPASSIEYAAAEQPIGIEGKPPVPPISPAEAIRSIDTCGCWVALTPGNVRRSAPVQPQLNVAAPRAFKPLRGNACATMSFARRGH